MPLARGQHSRYFSGEFLHWSIIRIKSKFIRSCCFRRRLSGCEYITGNVNAVFGGIRDGAVGETILYFPVAATYSALLMQLDQYRHQHP
jgi:hypothetical protein